MTFQEKIKAFAAKKEQTDKLFRQKTVVQSTRYTDKDGHAVLDVVMKNTLAAFIDSGNWQVVAVETELPQSIQSIFSEQAAQSVIDEFEDTPQPKGRPKKS